MKFVIAIIGLVAAQKVTDEESDVPRADWRKAEVIYGKDNWKTCADGCTGTDTVCAKHMWEYNGQSEVGEGCWNKALCKGTGAYYMFD